MVNTRIENLLLLGCCTLDAELLELVVPLLQGKLTRSIKLDIGNLGIVV